MNMSNCCSGDDFFDLCGPRYGISKDKLRELIEELCECEENSNSGPSGVADPGIDYSYDEQWTGRLWLDGSKVYQKGFKIDSGVPTAPGLSIPHDIDNLNQVVDCRAIVNDVTGDTNTPYFAPTPYIGTSSGSYISLACDRSNIFLQSLATSQTQRKGPAYVSIQYTCTDR